MKNGKFSPIYQTEIGLDRLNSGYLLISNAMTFKLFLDRFVKV